LAVFWWALLLEVLRIEGKKPTNLPCFFEAGYSAAEQLGKGQEVATVSGAIARHEEKIARSECFLSPRCCF